MKKQKLAALLSIVAIIIILTSCDNKPYTLSEGYMYIQKNERRNDSTEWKLVWEDSFNNKSLDTNTWRRIGLFETEKWRVPKKDWKEVKNCFRYISAIDSRVVTFDESNICLVLK